MKSFPLVISDGKDDIFIIKHNGDLVLRGKKIAKDKNLADFLMGYGTAFKKMTRKYNLSA